MELQDRVVAAAEMPEAAPWLPVAYAEAGVVPAPVGACNPRIRAYHTGTNVAGYDDKVSWCSSFANWCLGQVGLAGTGSALARSWLEWGQSLQAPRVGCIVVLYRDDPASWKGHVGFFVRAGAEQVFLWGGNQLGTVCENAYPLASVLAYRWPLDAANPESA
ncbi:MAG: TIGR02594 family protein [Burkholderiales bacterium PBB3]|nr:MAG: TIGR02594 family protein [Burkholderiales bacterium PBB3]